MTSLRVENGFRPECDAVISAVRVALGVDDPSRLSFPEGFDWTAFQSAIDRHRVGAFLLRRLPRAATAVLPDDVKLRLMQAAALTAQRAAVRMGLLLRLVRELEENGVPVISVKGPLLAAELFGAAGARHAGDLDLLIDPADVDRADAVMREARRCRTTPAFELSPRQKALFHRVRHEYAYVDTETGIHLEVMWRLADAALTREVAREPPRITEIDGHAIRRLALETETLYLLSHGARHGWFSLFWLIDIARLVQMQQVDWTRVARRAAALGMSRPAWQGLWLAHELLGVSLPHAFAPPAPRAVRRLVLDAHRHLAAPVPVADDTPRQPLWRAFYHLRRHDHWRTWLEDMRSMFLHPLISTDRSRAERPWAFLLARPFQWIGRRLRERVGI